MWKRLRKRLVRTVKGGADRCNAARFPSKALGRDNQPSGCTDKCSVSFWLLEMRSGIAVEWDISGR
ncbi:hypothetical protein Ct61P_01024 [Colletotrichum tofieldiae]|nr:hypothetical protein Ct61P_01024 [Colletotrichum tofieldiae]